MFTSESVLEVAGGRAGADLLYQRRCEILTSGGGAKAQMVGGLRKGFERATCPVAVATHSSRHWRLGGLGVEQGQGGGRARGGRGSGSARVCREGGGSARGGGRWLRGLCAWWSRGQAGRVVEKAVAVRVVGGGRGGSARGGRCQGSRQGGVVEKAAAVRVVVGGRGSRRQCAWWPRGQAGRG